MFGWRRRKHSASHLHIGSHGRAGGVRRIAQDMMVALVVVLMVFGFAAWDSRAHALARDSERLTTNLLTLSEYVPRGRESIAAMRPAHQQQPRTNDVLPALSAPGVIPGALLLPSASGPGDSAARVAVEEQIVWRYSGRTGDHTPWFAVEQNKKRAAMTGRPQFLLMALVFAIMSAVTLGLWRQLNGPTPCKNHSRRGSPRRLR